MYIINNMYDHMFSLQLHGEEKRTCIQTVQFDRVFNNPSGNHLAMGFVVNARKPAGMRKTTTFR